jgi:hypothetical protein
MKTSIFSSRENARSGNPTQGSIRFDSPAWLIRAYGTELAEGPLQQIGEFVNGYMAGTQKFSAFDVRFHP